MSIIYLKELKEFLNTYQVLKQVPYQSLHWQSSHYIKSSLELRYLVHHIGCHCYYCTARRYIQKNSKTNTIQNYFSPKPKRLKA